MHQRTRLINTIIAQNNYQRYLEIGVDDRSNFDHVKCPYKIGVDPDPKFEHSNDVFYATSDKFFEYQYDWFDFIFIDGLHYSDQVIVDFQNSLRHLKPGGIIALHDVYPQTYNEQIVPRKQIRWTGDVWRAWIYIRQNYSYYKCYTYNVETGIGIVEVPQSNYKTNYLKDYYIMEFDHQSLSYQAFQAYAPYLLNLIPYDF